MNARAVLVLLGLLLLSGSVVAHSTHKAGPFTVKVGWAQEPPVAFERNHVTVAVWNTTTGAGVAGLATTLTATIAHAGETKALALVEADAAPGNYSAPIEPTQAGLYSVNVGGRIQDTSVNTDFSLDEVGDASADRFPPTSDASGVTAADLANLSRTVDQLKDKAGSAGSKVPAAGLAATVALVGVAALTLRRRV
jgi:hypothetical protein